MRKQIFTRRSSSPVRKRREFTYFRFWLAHGLSVRAATVAAAADCRSVDDLRELGWQTFQAKKNCGTRTLEELSELVGGWPDAPPRNLARIELSGAVNQKHHECQRVPEAGLATRTSNVAFACNSDEPFERYDGELVAEWIRRVSDQTLIEEVRRRGIAVECDDPTCQR